MGYTAKMARSLSGERYGKRTARPRWGRAHSEFVASVLKETRIEGHGLSTASAKYVREQWETVVDKFADKIAAELRTDFNRERFLRACGVGP